MPDHDTPLGSRPIRKRAPAFPAALLDRSVMDLLSQAEVPLSAYDLIERLHAHGRPLAVPSVYRSLERLCAQDLIEKIAMLSAFRIKDVPRAMLMICLACGRATPLPVPTLHEALERKVEDTGFTPRTIALEVSGLCADCRRQGRS